MNASEKDKIKPRMNGHKLALLNNRFDGVVRAMTNTLLRTARSAVLNTARDFSCCILTADHEMLAMAESLPIHVMSGPDLMAKCMADFFPDLKQGDAFLHNSPYHGNSHAADWTVLVPVIDKQGQHRFTVIAKAHLADCGNAIPTTYSAGARDVYEEGALIFPCVQIQENYKNREDVLRIAKIRIRVPELWHGDFLALLGATRIGERRLLELIEEIPKQDLSAYPREWFDYSEARMIEAIRKLPSGETITSAWHDPIAEVLPDGIEIKTQVKVDSNNAMLYVDLTDNPECQPCGLNLTEATSRTAAMMGLFTALGAVVPPNAGSFRRINVTLKDNCVVGIPKHPYSCSVATTNLSELLANCVVRAIAELGDGYGMAASGKASPAATSVISGIDKRPGQGPFVNQLWLGFTGGAGAPNSDAWLTIIGIGAAGYLRRDSIEILEMKYPVFVHSEFIVQDSEGAGRNCGAPSLHVEFGPLNCDDLTAVWLSEGTTYPSLGVRGGDDGMLAQQYVRGVDGSLSKPLGTFELVSVKPGERVVSVCGGGAGYGPPQTRKPERVARDVQRGWVSVQRAQEKYKVIVDESGALDSKETSSLREADSMANY